MRAATKASVASIYPSNQPSLGRLLRVPSPPIDDIYEFPWKKEMMKRERHGRKGKEDKKKTTTTTTTTEAVQSTV
jgi:hypothetical protein